MAAAVKRWRHLIRTKEMATLDKNEEEARIQALKEEGYRELAEENRRMAEEAWPLACEMMLKYTRWDEEEADPTPGGAVEARVR